MSSPDLDALLRMAAAMGLGPEVIKQVRANPEMLRRLAERMGSSAGSQSTRNDDADLFDKLKEQADAAKAVAEREQRLPPRHPPRKRRADQLREVEAGRALAIDTQNHGKRGFQFSFIGMPKPSSLKPLSDLETIHFDEMQVTRTHKDRYIAVRIISLPVVMVGITFLAEDTTGRAEMVAIYNLDLHGMRTGPDLDALFPLGTILAIREPTFKMNNNSTMSLVRMDSPTDFEIIRPDHALFSSLSFSTSPPVPPRPVTFDFKAHGNKYFAAKKDLLAVEAYTEGLACSPPPELSLVLHLNRSQAHLRIKNFASAYHDSSFVLEQLDDGVSGPPQANLKATLRLARALEGMRHLDLALEQFIRVIKLDAHSKEGAEGNKRVGRKIRERDTGEYDWRELEKLAKTETRLDVGDFVGPLEVVKMRERGGGRGVVATRDIEAGELLLVECALDVGEPHEGGFMLTFDFHTNTATKSSKLDLVSMLASTIKDDPTIGSLVYGLHGGAEFPPSQELAFDSLQGRPLPDETERQFVDIARLEAICSTNAFNAGSSALLEVSKVSDSNREQETPSALFLGASLFNHSCSPNALWSPLRNIMILDKHLPDGCECALCVAEALDVPAQTARRASLLEKELREIQKGTEELLRRGAISPRDLTRLNLRLKPIVRQLEATYSKSRGALRPEMANVYHTMGELTDPTQASTREEGNRCSIKSLVAAGAVFKEEDAKVKIIAAPSSTSKDAVPQLLNIAHRYNRPPTKPSQARKWVVAAFEMDRILHGDDWSRFAERYAEDIEAFRLQSVVKECKPSVK